MKSWARWWPPGVQVRQFKVGERLGVPWLGYTCGTCRYCRQGRENLCDNPGFTGYTLDGGYADYAVADQRYSFPLPGAYGDTEAAPLLCAGLIGYRSYRMARDAGERLGIYGFGAAAHITVQIAVYQGKKVYAFTRPGDTETQEFARRLGAVWAGSSDELPPEELDAAIIFAPVGALIPAALRASAKGGVVVSGGIHLSDIPSFSYDLLWGERVVRSVANLTRADGEEFLELAPRVPVRTEVQTFPLQQANEALDRLRRGQIQGAAVLVVSSEKILRGGLGDSYEVPLPSPQTPTPNPLRGLGELEERGGPYKIAPALPSKPQMKIKSSGNQAPCRYPRYSSSVWGTPAAASWRRPWPGTDAGIAGRRPPPGSTLWGLWPRIP